MTAWLQDLKLAIRRLQRRPAFSLAAVLTLAVGIGATVAIFGVAHSVLLQPLPYPQPERLVSVFQAYPQQDSLYGGLSRPDFDDWAEGSRQLAGLAAYSGLPSDPTLTGGDRPAILDVTWTTGTFFSTLGVEPTLGRAFTPAEEARGERLMVLSWEAFQRRFGGDPARVGGTVELDGEPWVVTGVLPPGHAYPFGTEAWLPIGSIPESSIPRYRMVRFLDAVGRLAPDATTASAQRELSGIAAGLAESFPDSNAGADGATVEPLVANLVGGVRAPLGLLSAAVLLLLLIACSNVAGLWLVRGLDRRRETALRAALGAGRLRLMREMITESLVVSAAGGALGLLLALWGGELLVRLGGELLPRPVEIAPHAGLLAFAVAVTAGCSLLVGLLPAWSATAGEPRFHLATASRAGLDRRPARALPGLVIAELLLATFLLVGAGLLLRSLDHLLATPTGFDGEGVVAVSLGLPEERYPERPDYLAAHQRIVETLAALPGIETVATIRNLPLSGDSVESHAWSAEGPAAAGAAETRVHIVGPELFRTLRIPRLAGRELSRGDDADAPGVVVVNQRLAERAFADADPVDRTLWVGDTPLRVVGVVGDVRHRSLAEPPEAAAYVPLQQWPRRSFTLLVRGRPGVTPAQVAVREAIWSIDPDLALQRITTLSEVTAGAASRPRFFSTLLGLLATIAAALAALGIYGVVSYATGLRRHEIGVRLTLGADRGQILRLLLGRGLAWGALGVALGVAASIPAARLLESQLYGVGPADPWAYLGACGLLLAMTAGAVYLPASRGARLDPRRALDSG